jgi:VWFA-related protein
MALLLTAVSAFAAKPPAAPPPPSFGAAVEVNVVNVEVYATAKDGSRVTDLKKDDFTVLEDGKPVEITNFEVVAGGGMTPNRGPGAQEAPVPAAPENAWNLIVLFDNLSLRPASRDRALRQLKEFLDHEVSPGDRVMLVTHDFGLHVRLPFTSDPAAIDQALQEIGKLSAHGPDSDRDRRQAFATMMTIQEVSINGPDPLPCPQNIATPAYNYADLRRQEVRRSIGALTLLVNSLSGVPGRKAVLHVSDGLPIHPGEELFQFLIEICGGGTSGFGKNQTISATGPSDDSVNDDSEVGGPTSRGRRVGRVVDPNQVFDAREIGPRAYQAASQGPLDAQSYSVAKDLQTLAAHANAHRVTLYTLQPGLAAPDASDASFGPNDRMFQFPSIGSALRASNRESLQFLADETGGRAILDANQFLPDLARMREDFASFYSLGYTPAHNGDGREHKIEVRVKRPGVRLRYRQSYRDKPTLEKTVDRTFAALLYGIEDNPLEIKVEVGDQTPGPAGTWTVPIRLKIPLFKLAILNHEEIGTFAGNLRLFVATHTPDGGSSPLRQVEVPIRIPRKQVLNAMGQFYLYTLTLQLKPGEQQVAVAVRDEIGATTSYLSRSVTAGQKTDRAASDR